MPASATANDTLLFRANALQTWNGATEALLTAARNHPSVFNEYVLRHEEDGRPIRQAPVHDQWQEELCLHDRVVIWSHVEAGKTNQISIGRVLWELGKNPNLRVVILSKTEGFAKKIVRAIAQYIERSKELREVFPHLRPSTNVSMPWMSTAITVQRDSTAKEASVKAVGIGGQVVGDRIDLLIIDDILDYKNTRTKSQRDEVWNWVQASTQGRMTDNARMWAVGNAWHPDDAMHRLAALPLYTSKRYPVMNDRGELTWPEVWPLRRIENFKLNNDPIEYARQLLCVARDDNESRFKKEWLEGCFKRGRGYRLMHSIYDRDGTSLLPEGYTIVHGVDLASRKSEDADLTVIFTILLWPDGTRQVLNISSGKWNGPEILTHIEDAHQRYGGLFLIENVAAQQYIIDFARMGMTNAVVKPFLTGKNKADPAFGIESLAAELASGRWIIPNRKGGFDKEVEAWISEMLFYNPKDHTGDRFMASWFAREGCRFYDNVRSREMGGGSVGVRVLGNDRPRME